jgi:hypothetical protein
MFLWIIYYHIDFSIATTLLKRKDDNAPLNCFLTGTILYFSVYQGVLAFALRFVLQSLSFSVILFGAFRFYWYTFVHSADMGSSSWIAAGEAKECYNGIAWESLQESSWQLKKNAILFSSLIIYQKHEFLVG